MMASSYRLCDYRTRLFQASRLTVHLVGDVLRMMFPHKRSGCRVLTQTLTQFLRGGVGNVFRGIAMPPSCFRALPWQRLRTAARELGHIQWWRRRARREALRWCCCKLSFIVFSHFRWCFRSFHHAAQTSDEVFFEPPKALGG